MTGQRRGAFRKEPTLRTAYIVYLLAQGAKLTTMQVAEKTGLSRWAARTMMDILSASHDVPITCVDGYWQIVAVTATDKR